MSDKKKGKLKLILVSVFLVLAVCIVSVFFFVMSSTTVVALLHVEGGAVQVDQGSGWVDAKDEMELSLDDKVRTLDGEASVILYESVIISLDPDTEVAIGDLDRKNLVVKQGSGVTWNKFTGLLGVEGLSVETPNTVAVVRGTSFGVGMDSVVVGEGSVEVLFGGESISVGADEKVVLQTDEGGVKRFVKLQLSGAEREDVVEKMRRTVGVLKKLRKMEIDKKKLLVSALKKRYGVSDADVSEKLEDADRGEYDLEEVERKSPVKIESVRKVRRITEKIIDENKAIERLMPRAQTGLRNATEPKLVVQQPIVRT